MNNLRELICIPLVGLALIAAGTMQWTIAGLSLILAGIVWEISDNHEQKKMWRDFDKYLDEDNGDDH